jgi:electron transfer flavoprotein beta subunit
VAPTSIKNGATPDTHKYNEGARYASLKGIMQAKKKPIEQVQLSAVGSDTTLSTTYSKFELPPARSGSTTFVESVDDLLDKLKNVAKVL